MHALPAIARPLVTLASDTDGEAAFMEFIRSAGRAFSQNQAAAPLVGLGILVVLIVLADWKLAGWLERLWRKRRTRHRTDGAGHGPADG